MIDAYIGLGSNLDCPLKQLKQAIETINTCPDIRVNKISGFYKNPPMGPVDQDEYINAVLKIQTTLSALDLLYFLQDLELKQHRKKTLKWGPRTIDADILLYGNQEIHLPNLIIPHPGLENRPFVVWPLLEIAPELILPNHTPLKVIAKNNDNRFLIKMREENEHTLAP